MEIINWRIAGHPMNWLTLFLMVLIASILMHLVLDRFSPVKPSAGTSNTY